MHKGLEEICVALEALAAAVKSAYADDRPLTEVIGWMCPAVNRHELAQISLDLVAKIRKVAPDEISVELDKRLVDVPRRLLITQQNTVPQMYTGNGGQAVPAYINTIEMLAKTLEPILGWQAVDNKSMPAPTARRLRAAQSTIDAIIGDTEKLEEQMRLIREATETAEALPSDLQDLKNARDTVNRLSVEAEKSFLKIDGRLTDAVDLLGKMKEKEVESGRLVNQCEEAYRVTTSKGLAGAFDQRAVQLNRTMSYWVVGLLVALVAGAFMGYLRIEVLSIVLKEGKSNLNDLWVQLVLALFSVGAPLWFAWLATKQIGQRFRLAEDYAFKASVSKAYEGYRREAARIDEAFEARLFGSVLSRLEEAPLRLVETATHGSPWQEFFNSDVFQKALSEIPELKNHFLDICKVGVERFGKGKKQGKTVVKAAKEDKEE